MINYIFSKDSIVGVTSINNLAEVLADNEFTSVDETRKHLLREMPGLIIEIPIILPAKSIVVDEITMAPYCLLQDKSIETDKYIFVNPRFTSNVLKEFWKT